MDCKGHLRPIPRELQRRNALSNLPRLALLPPHLAIPHTLRIRQEARIHGGGIRGRGAQRRRRSETEEERHLFAPRRSHRRLADIIEFQVLPPGLPHPRQETGTEQRRLGTWRHENPTTAGRGDRRSARGLSAKRSSGIEYNVRSNWGVFLLGRSNGAD